MFVSCTTSFVEGGLAAATAGGSFTPHVIAVEIGEVSYIIWLFFAYY